MTTRSRREPKRGNDHDGAEVVFVPLANCNEPARVFPESLEDLRARGISLSWTWNHVGGACHYVRCPLPGFTGNLETVARLITGAGRGEIVRYADGDRRNLRRDNLVVTDGYARGHRRKDRRAA